ncbi:AAA family ATPase, partial [Escherichia coli]|nr:AAA family ATPase [Escherichia coli]
MTTRNNYPIEYFRMTGVHGYKDITMKMKGKTTVFVSENGAGKTTILNAIRLLLEQDFTNLMRIDFKSIFIKILDHEEVEIKNERASLIPFGEIKAFLNERFSLNESFWDDRDITKFAKTLIDSKQNEFNDDALVNDLYNTVKYPKD